MALRNPSMDPVDDPVVHAVGQTKISRSAEAHSGNGQDIFLQESVHEQNVIGDGRFREEIKGPFRLDKGIARLSKPAAEDHPASSGTRRHPRGTPWSLGRIRCIRAGAFTNPRIRLQKVKPSTICFQFSILGFTASVPDPLAGQRQVFGVRSDHQAIRVSLKNAGDPRSVVNELAVGLVGEQINRLLVSFLYVFK